MAPSRARFRWRSRLPAIAVTLAAPLLLYMIAGRAPPPLEASDPLPLLRLKINESLAPGRRMDPATLDAARRAARHAPLAFEPFFVAARVAEQAGRLDRAIALMEEARRRRANYLPTRLQLAAYYLADGRPAAMFGELEIALRLNSEIRQAVLPEMAKLIGDASVRPVLADALARNPGWRREFFDAAAARRIAPADALALWRAVQARRPAGGAALERQLYVQALLQDGQAARARALWLSGLSPQAQRTHELIFDGDFTGARAQPPFGWEFHQLDVGRAEILRTGGESALDVNYFGGSNAMLAEQVLALPPGRYRLSFAGRSDAGVSAANFFWVLTCHQSGQSIARIPIVELSAAWRTRRAEFTVPAGCPGQRLRLVAEPGDLSAPVQFALRSLRIER